MSACNMIKVRDDHHPIEFLKRDVLEGDKIFHIKNDIPPIWCQDNDFSISDLRNRIEPWLTSLFQSEHD